jgi:hypothetical protein
LELFDDFNEEEPLTMTDATGAAEVLLGLAGFRILEVTENPGRGADHGRDHQ